MKTFKEVAQEAYKKNKDTKGVFVTEDRYCFYNKNAANLHATTSGKKKQKVYSFSATDLAIKEKSKDLQIDKPSVEERIAAVEKLASVEQIDLYIKGEKAKTVLAAAKAKKEALTKKETPKEDAQTTKNQNPA
ncbi:hypothetical protein [Tenacibaculum maritimum]|uniref:hypothetical protein n=1 Tax=Tenacibaculum maritimum TaxID=107401 RepID=UPI002306EBBD|nr:hypothetical protein [Tenacibaculum maritimum]MDB0599796.1 hypothetical protein [Tenacibaculum maritimum]MDB0610906.1 hypothetical protein [Tenacibaculum maritimum]